MEKEQLLTPKFLVAFVMADIEINLLQNEEQNTYKKKSIFTRDEIIEQLEATSIKICDTIEQAGILLDEPLKCRELV